jgi:flagellum-specific peptidoglycan hydrolase FlgJ
MATYTREEFVKKYSPYINGITKGTGLLTGTVVGQAILESSGNYNTGGQWKVGGSKLSQEANNYFGIKADPSWKGKVYNIRTREVVNGKNVYQNDDFRKYDSIEDSIKDHLDFLLKNSRYRQAGVFNAKTVAEQAAAIKKAGYATDPNYANAVTQVYESVKGYISKGIQVIQRNLIPTIAITAALVVGGYFLYKTLKKK